ncbi:hypothetical protein [Kitasatospora viridis]|uniref:Uncharacterized protein n=1 Tax=Kitasatospora viridis TaxID=281105 RepID=A0A561S933_9ACTN|nr:hypothetical protein [Kitasatospora viridis]TWF71382.1 hypothetical protein FHX73_1912 [Kitasatospora viridis]
MNRPAVPVVSAAALAAVLGIWTMAAELPHHGPAPAGAVCAKVAAPLGVQLPLHHCHHHRHHAPDGRPGHGAAASGGHG